MRSRTPDWAHGYNFFHALRALNRYFCFPSWDDLLPFMFQKLELGPVAAFDYPQIFTAVPSGGSRTPCTP